MKLLPISLLLLGGFLLSMAGSYLQHRYYLRVVNALAREFKRSEYVLASGIRKGRLRGSIAVLVLRRDDPDVVERAMVMSGATLLARFRNRPELEGRLDPAALAACSASVRGAMQDALDRGRRTVERRADLERPEPGAADGADSEAEGVEAHV